MRVAAGRARIVPRQKEKAMYAAKWIERARTLGPEIAEHATRHDVDGTFVSEAYEALKEDGLFKALVPLELGGMGAGLVEACEFIRELAQYCGSTALAYSMHSHLVAATVWKHRHGQPGEALLRKIAEQNLVLVSTGAGDWLESNGVMEKVEGGYRYTSKKPFASGSPMADVMITSGRYDDPEEGPMVLHFPLSLRAEGVERGDDWDTHGMRGTGSNTVHISGAFIRGAGQDDACRCVHPNGEQGDGGRWGGCLLPQGRDRAAAPRRSSSLVSSASAQTATCLLGTNRAWLGAGLSEEAPERHGKLRTFCA